MYYVGNLGYSWASTVTGTQVYYLDFYYGAINPNYLTHRAYGFQLRCLQE